MQMTVQLRLTYRFIYIALVANLSKVTPAVGKLQIARFQQLSFDIAVFNQQSRKGRHSNIYTFVNFFHDAIRIQKTFRAFQFCFFGLGRHKNH